MSTDLVELGMKFTQGRPKTPETPAERILETSIRKLVVCRA